MTALAGRRPGRLLAAVVLSACIGLVGGALAAWAIYARFGPVERVVTQVVNGGAGGGVSVAAIAQQAAGSVVEVATKPVDPQSLAAGTAGFTNGFVVSADGLIVTSIHAVRGATALRVATTDGHAYPATIVRADPAHGVVVLRAVGAQGLAPLGFASQAARPGDLAIAVAHSPFQSTTLSTGTVSSTGRSLTLNDGEPALSDALTVDATPDPREDGAPLLTGNGAVVGVVLDAGGAAPGVVALSGRAAADLVQQVNGTGSASTPSLGASAVILDVATAAAAGLPQGALVRTVDPGGPAAQAGLRPGDVVTSVDGVSLDVSHQLDPAALGLTPGQRITLDVVSAGLPRTLTVTVGSTAPAAQ